MNPETPETRIVRPLRILSPAAIVAILIACLLSAGAATASTYYWLNGQHIVRNSLPLNRLTSAAITYLHHPGPMGPRGYTGLSGRLTTFVTIREPAVNVPPNALTYANLSCFKVGGVPIASGYDNNNTGAYVETQVVPGAYEKSSSSGPFTPADEQWSMTVINRNAYAVTVNPWVECLY